MLEINSPGGVERLERLDAAEEDQGSDDLILRPNQGMSVRRLEGFLEEINQQPPWRRQADKECDYFDGNQLTSEQIAELEDRGFAPLITNLVQPTINVVLGMEEKTRSDWRVRAEDGEITDDMAEALSSRLHKAEVETRADKACSDAYAGEVKVGIDWVEVGRNTDPFASRYRVKRVHRREIFWDWRSQEPDLSDARYLVRKRWLDEDTAVGAFPEHAKLIEYALAGWADWDKVATINDSSVLELNRALDVQRGFSVEQFEWLNTIRRRVAAYEVWYRTVTRGHVLRLPNGRVVELDLNNDDHVMAIYTGQLEPVPAIFKKVRLAWWIGPHKVSDEASPYPHRHFPYVPFFGFREDRTNTPYGMIRAMLSPQDEINARRSKMLWLLNSKRVVADGDAVLDHDDAREEVGRPDAYIKLNPNRRPDSRFEVEEGGQLAAQQFQVLEAAKQEINQASGVYQSMMGQNSNASSGMAINSLIEQGSTTLAEINGNFRYARRLVGELLLELVREDLSKEINASIMVGEEGEQREVVVNRPATDELGNEYLENDVGKARVSVILDDVPSSPTFKQQQLMLLTELTKSLPESIQPLVVDMVIEAMDLPKKRQLLKRVREALGIGPDGATPSPQLQEAQAALQELQQALAQMQEQNQQMAQQLGTAQIKLANKDDEISLKARELAIKEADVAIKAQGQVVDQSFRAEETQAARDIAAEAEAEEPDESAAIEKAVQKAMAPLIEHLAKVLSQTGAGAPAQSKQMTQGA